MLKSEKKSDRTKFYISKKIKNCVIWINSRERFLPTHRGGGEILAVSLGVDGDASVVGSTSALEALRVAETRHGIRDRLVVPTKVASQSTEVES